MDVNIAEAKAELSKLVRLVESGRESTIWICRHNKRVARLVGTDSSPVSNRVGIAKGKLQSPTDLDMDNGRIADLFEGTL